MTLENAKIGTTVILNSGGPKMTISEVKDYGGGIHYASCIYFLEGILQPTVKIQIELLSKVS